MMQRSLLFLLTFGAAWTAPAATNVYLQHNLVADTPGVADVTDPNLINPWGVSTSSASPFWVSNQGSGLATLYSTSATATITAVSAIKVTIPAGAGNATPAGPTGQMANTTTVFAAT